MEEESEYEEKGNSLNNHWRTFTMAETPRLHERKRTQDNVAIALYK